MEVLDQKGRALEVVYVGGKHEDDIQFELAWMNSNETVPDEVYEFVADNYYAELYEAWYERQIDRAESYYEGDR